MPVEQSSETVPELPKGQSAILFPELNHLDRRGRPLAPIAKEAFDAMNEFLQSLDAQGARLIQIIEVDIDDGEQSADFIGGSGRKTKTVKVAIVNKS